MKIYLKERYKTYISIAFGLLIGFIVVTFLFDKPEYKSAVVAILFGLIIGGVTFLLKMVNTQKKRTRYLNIRGNK